MDDYYTLLGVDTDATVDDIRGAYRVRKDALDTGSEAGRADAARLNKAWNVLSDPYQRGRYDEQRSLAAGNGELVDDGELSSTNGAGAPSGSLTPRQKRAQDARDARTDRLRKQATISPPAGTRWPAPKQRVIAMVIDLFVLAVLFLGVGQFGANTLAKSQKPDVVKQVNALNDQITAQNKVKSDADKKVSADKKANNNAVPKADQDAANAAKTKLDDLTKQRDDAVKKLNPYFLTAILATFVLGFLYLAVPTALTGRTLGKRFQGLRVLREDGSPVGVRGAIVRFGLVTLVTLVLYLVLQQLAAVIVLFGVTTWMRNGNMQGMHDRFAHTIVVSDATA